MKETKAEYVETKSQAKVDQKSVTTQAEAEATDGQMTANYKDKKEKSDALSSSAKDACISGAKLKYRQ